MTKGIIVIPFHQPWEWSADYPNQTAYVLANDYTVICYLWAEKFVLKDFFKAGRFLSLIKKHSPNLYLVKPFYLLPFRKLRLIEFLNTGINILLLKLITSYLSFKTKPAKSILWNFYPIPEFITNPFGNKWKTLYDCADFFTGNVATKSEKGKILKDEKRLTKKVDAVFANSLVLQAHLKKWRADVHLVPQGFRVADFEKKAGYKSPKLLAKKPIIGFAGAVNHRINYDILIPLAKKHPEWSFVIWGPILDKERVTPEIWKRMATLLKFSNVSTGFLKDRTKLPGVFKQFDITIIPYDVTQEFNKYCYPMKLFEFFYLGLPVLATEVEELRRFPKFVKIAKDHREWEKILKELLAKKWPQKYKTEQRRLAYENSWENKVGAILKHI